MNRKIKSAQESVVFLVDFMKTTKKTLDDIQTTIDATDKNNDNKLREIKKDISQLRNELAELKEEIVQLNSEKKTAATTPTTPQKTKKKEAA